MPCPTCSHTLQRVVAGIFWCPRCGTLCEDHGENGFANAPKLVERCRQFAIEADPADPDRIPPLWHRLGILESIFPAGQLPPPGRPRLPPPGAAR